MEISNRVFVSFDGKCPYNCKHCFSFEILQPAIPRNIREIVDSLNGKDFDVIYVSQKKENFVSQDEGLSLCEELFAAYGCHLVILTRNVFGDDQIRRLACLHNKMRLKGKSLFMGISVIGLESAGVSEDLSVVPAPEERLRFAISLYNKGIPTMLLLRPLFPKQIVPVKEWKQIVDMIAGKVSCILSGPLMINDSIIERLKLPASALNHLCDADSDYLDGAIAGSMKYVDVREEMQELKSYCKYKGVPFFAHSMPAINYITRVSLTSQDAIPRHEYDPSEFSCK